MIGQLVKFGVIGVGGLSALVILALYTFQAKIIYVPRIPGVPAGYIAKPDEFDLDYEDVWLRTADGVKLHAWVVFRKGLRAEVRDLPLVVFLQENAGNMSMRLHFLRALVLILNCKCVILQYRGYGESEGTPSEVGLRKDVDALTERNQMSRALSAEIELLVERAKALGASGGHGHHDAGPMPWVSMPTVLNRHGEPQPPQLLCVGLKGSSERWATPGRMSRNMSECETLWRWLAYTICSSPRHAECT